MMIDEFMAEFWTRVGGRPAHIRLGQAAFNALRQMTPGFSEAVRGTRVDPFYHDGRVPLLCAKMAEHSDDLLADRRPDAMWMWRLDHE